MRCVYCKMASDRSRSVEHVVPEALGNHKLLLSPGIVCDGCNNYFSRKVEGPFLNAPAMQLLRHEQGLMSKRGRIPTLRAFAPQVGEATMHASTAELPRRIMFDSEELAHRWLVRGQHGRLLTEQVMTPPSPIMTSRFLAKVAIGCLADRLKDVEGGLDFLVDEPGFDRLRNHARRGRDQHWPVFVRRIYPANARWLENDDVRQKVWELDLLQDEDGYLYSILVVFGLEFAIHLGEPDISGYRRWLLLHAGQSPLYSGRNAAETLTRNGTFDCRGQRVLVGFSRT